MAERGDRVKYDASYVEGLLRAYKERRLREKVMEKEDEELRFLDRCLNNVEGDGKILLRAMYVDGVSSRRCALSLGLTRYYVETECKKLLALIAVLFSEKFS